MPRRDGAGKMYTAKCGISRFSHQIANQNMLANDLYTRMWIHQNEWQCISEQVYELISHSQGDKGMKTYTSESQAGHVVCDAWRSLTECWTICKNAKRNAIFMEICHRKYIYACHCKRINYTSAVFLLVRFFSAYFLVSGISWGSRVPSGVFLTQLHNF